MGVKAQARVRRAEQVVREVDSLPRAERDSVLRRRNEAHLYFQAKALTDFWYYLWHVVYRHARCHYDEALHREMATFLQDWTMEGGGGIRQSVGEKFLIVSREHCKSQMGMAYIAWVLAREPDERIMVRSHKDPKAEEILFGLKQLLLSEKHQKWFPWSKPALDGKRKIGWSKESILVDRELSGVRTMSVERYGLESDNTGSHFTMAVYDDWETKDSANSEEIRPKLFENYELDDNVLLGGSRVIVIGTPYRRDCFLDQAMRRKGIFENRRYSLMIQPCFVSVLDAPIRGDVVELLPDRSTFRCPAEAFPTGDESLFLLPADVTFYSTQAKDTLVERREIVWNDAQHFKVNRPYHESLGDPLHFEIGTQVPACPKRFTQDAIDLSPRDPFLVEEAPYKDNLLVRSSLLRKRLRQGTTWFASQMLLDPRKLEDAIYTADNLQLVTEEELPDGPRNWYRTVDLASAKQTECRTSILYGFYSEKGVYLVDLKVGNFKVMDIILELLLGELRLRDKWDASLRWTSFEVAAREEYLDQFLRVAERDPYSFFKSSGGRYERYAEDFFRDTGSVWMKRHEIRRGAYQTKGQRLAAPQPMFEQGRVFALENLPHLDRLRSEMETVTVDARKGHDVLETVADMIREGHPPRAERKEAPKVNEFVRRNLQALRRRHVQRHITRMPV